MNINIDLPSKALHPPTPFVVYVRAVAPPQSTAKTKMADSGADLFEPAAAVVVAETGGESKGDEQDPPILFDQAPVSSFIGTIGTYGRFDWDTYSAMFTYSGG